MSEFVYDDGGRAAAGYKGKAGDCVCRAIAIAARLPYADVYAALADGAGNERKSRGRSARNGIHTSRQWFKDYMAELGATWTPTMAIGAGCKVHARADELPKGRLVLSLSRHYAACINGVIHDIDPDVTRDGTRCVYGYWKFA